jgi:hypothetical protein
MVAAMAVAAIRVDNLLIMLISLWLKKALARLANT